MIVFLDIILLLAPGMIAWALTRRFSEKKEPWQQTLLLWLLYDVLIFGGCCIWFAISGRGFAGTMLFSVRPLTEGAAYIYRTDAVKEYALAALICAVIVAIAAILIQYLRKRRGANEQNG